MERSPDGDETAATVRHWLPEAAVLLGEQGATLAVGKRLAHLAHPSIAEGDTLTCLARQLGDAAARLGNRTAAHACYLQALDAAEKIGFRPELALARLGLAELLVEDGNAAAQSEARIHLELAIAELQDMHIQPALARAMLVRNHLRTARAKLARRHPAFETLTAREREIARLIANGRSNREIADELVIAEGTLAVHVKHVLSKLGYRSRSQVASWFAQQREAEGEDGGGRFLEIPLTPHARLQLRYIRMYAGQNVKFHFEDVEL